MSIPSRLVFLLIFLLTACSSGIQPDVTIALNDLAPLPTPALDQVPLRVAVASIISPRGTVESYTSLLEYLGEKLNRPVELIQRRTYLEVNDLIERGDVDLAFVCTSAYIVGHDDFNLELLAAPQVNGATEYYAYLIVSMDKKVNQIADLAGQVFAFTDPISLTGRVYPTALVQSLGKTPEEFFSRTFYTYSHDKAIYAVASGLADGASVDSMVYEFALRRDPTLAQKVKVIMRSPPFGIPPVVVNPNLRPQIKAELQSLLLEMDGDPLGRAALDEIGIDRFIFIEDKAYANARSLMQEVFLPDLP